MDGRVCARCGTFTDDFAKNQRYCRPCKRAYMQQYIEQNREYFNERNRRDYERHGDKRRARQRARWHERKAEQTPSTDTRRDPVAGD